MLMTTKEATAAGTICPILCAGVISSPRESESLSGHVCRGVDCAMWRFAGIVARGADVDMALGYCGLAGVPKHSPVKG